MHPRSRWTRLVFSGGGPNGLLHLGALKVLEATGHLDDIRSISGTSIGAILGLAVAVRYPLDQMIQDLELFLPAILSPDFNLMNLYKGRAIRSIQPIQDFLEKVLRASGLSVHINFRDLQALPHTRDFATCATCLSTNTLQCFSAAETPLVPVIEAVKASASVPLIFPPVRIDRRDYVDGGLILNVPIGVLPPLPPDECALVFWIKDDSQTKERPFTPAPLSNKVVAMRSAQASYGTQNALVGLWFTRCPSVDLLVLPAFSTGFLPIPIKNLVPPIQTGVHWMLHHLLLRRPLKDAPPLAMWFLQNLALWKGLWSFLVLAIGCARLVTRILVPFVTMRPKSPGQQKDTKPEEKEVSPPRRPIGGGWNHLRSDGDASRATAAPC